jgi:hypothetical protein
MLLKINHQVSAQRECSRKEWFCDGLSIEEVSKALKRIPAARLTFAVGLIFQQTHVILGGKTREN